MRVLDHEGGFVDHPDDPGGATKYGISLRFYRRAIDPTVGPNGIWNLTQSEAVEIYFKYFWQPWFDAMPPEMAYQVFDMSVNAGLRTAVKCLQRALRAFGWPLVDDGLYGPKTQDALRRTLDEGKVPLGAYRAERAGVYRVLAAKRPANRAFLKGWLNRAYGVRLD